MKNSSTQSRDSKKWLLETLRCVECIPNEQFTSDDIYKFVPELSERHPDNQHIRDKLRQQLQVLRDMGLIIFEGNGVYQKNGDIFIGAIRLYHKIRGI